MATQQQGRVVKVYPVQESELKTILSAGTVSTTLFTVSMMLFSYSLTWLAEATPFKKQIEFGAILCGIIFFIFAIVFHYMGRNVISNVFKTSRPQEYKEG